MSAHAELIARLHAQCENMATAEFMTLEVMQALTDAAAALREESGRLDAIERGNWAVEPVEGNIMPAGSFAVHTNRDDDPEPWIYPTLRQAIDAAIAGVARREAALVATADTRAIQGTGSNERPRERCKHGATIGSCELGYPGCVCADEGNAACEVVDYAPKGEK